MALARTQRMMATDVSAYIAVEPARVAAAQVALDACFAWFAEVERRLTRFDAASELCALNRSAGSWFVASETLYSAVHLATRMALASDGLFNPALLRQIEALGYDRDFSLLSQSEVGAPAPEAPDVCAPREPQPAAPLDAWRDIRFERATQRIYLPAGVAIDLGGIAKGWAADVALERYCQPFPGALLNVGGDLRLHGGPQPGSPWSIGIRDPREAGESSALVWNRATVAFSRGALATSGAVRRWWRKDGVRYHHLLDPRTGQPLPLWTSAEEAGADLREIAQRESQIASVTALAPSGALAEVATKVALARGLTQAMALVERAWGRWGAIGPADECDAGVALIFTLSDGRVVHSANLTAWLATWGTDTASLPMIVNAPGAQPLELGALG